MVIVEARSDRGAWIEASGQKVAVWQGHLQGLYVEWSVAVNGLEVAAKRYKSQRWNAEVGGFYVQALRQLGPKRHGWTKAHYMTGPEASDAHKATMLKLPTWGLIDYYAAFERFVFELYRLWLDAHPEVLCCGPDFSYLPLPHNLHP